MKLTLRFGNFEFRRSIKTYTDTVLQTVLRTKHQVSRVDNIVNKNNKVVPIVRNKIIHLK